MLKCPALLLASPGCECDVTGDPPVVTPCKCGPARRKRTFKGLSFLTKKGNFHQSYVTLSVKR